MTATLLPNARQQFWDTNGRPLAGGSVYFYIPNTSTLKNTWQDVGKTVLNTNPVVLDSSGQAIIYGDGQYRQVVYDVHGNLIWDKLTDSYALNSEFQSFVTNIEGTTGSSLIGFIQNGVGAVRQTVQDSLREHISSSQWGAVGDGAADDTADLQSMFDNCPKILNGTIYEARVYIPAGTYKLTSRIKIPTTSGQNVRWFIEGAGPLQTKIFQTTLGEPVFDVREVVGTAGNQSVIMNIGMSGPAGTGQSYVGAQAACIIGQFFIGWRVSNCWFTSMYYGIRMTDAVASSNVGCEELYAAWNVFEFIQNPIAVNGVTTSVAIASRSASGNVATLTTSTPHGLQAGQKIGVRGMVSPAYCQSNIQVLAVPTSTTFTYRIGAVSSEATTADTTGHVYWLNARSVHLVNNEFASVARTDIGGLGSDAAVNLNACETVTMIGNRYAYGVGKGLIATNCRDMIISGEDFSMANESINASIGAYGQENMTFDNSIDVQIGPCLYSTNISGANVQLKNGSNVNISGGTFSNVAGAAAVKASGLSNEIVMIGATMSNVLYSAIEIDSKASLINSRISSNKVGAMAPTAKMINMLAGVLDSSVVVEGNFPDTLWAAVEGRWSRAFPIDVTVAGTVPLATLNLTDYGTAVVTLRVNGLSQGDGAAGYEIRYSLYRTTGATTITAIGASVSYGSVAGEAQMSAIASGNQTQLQVTFSSALGFSGTVEIEAIGSISNIVRLY